MPERFEAAPAGACGVKFCGGCNPRYDRRKAFEAVRKRFEGRISFEFAQEGGSCGFLLYVAGCPCRCTALDAYRFAELVVIWEEEGVCEAVNRMEKMLATL
jgi:hypothetical protein